MFKKVKIYSLLTLVFVFALSACAAPPAAEEPEPQATSAGVLEQAEEESAESADPPTAAPVQPTAEPKPEDYPTPAPVVVDTAYPEPDQELIDELNAYPEPATDVSQESTNGEADEPAVETGPQSREVAIAAPDELNLFGTFNTNGSEAAQPGVLLLHMLGGSRGDWDQTGFTKILNDAGYATLALDMRGHGDSLSEVDWALAEQDLAIVWEWFLSQPEVDAGNSMIIGASIGGNLALRTAAGQPSAKAAVLLSPGINYREVTTDDAIIAMDRPVLMVAMTSDSYAADSVISLSELNSAHSTAVVEDGSAHGTRMFGAFVGLEQLIVDFLNETRG